MGILEHRYSKLAELAMMVAVVMPCYAAYSYSCWHAWSRTYIAPSLFYVKFPYFLFIRRMFPELRGQVCRRGLVSSQAYCGFIIRLRARANIKYPARCFD